MTRRPTPFEVDLQDLHGGPASRFRVRVRDVRPAPRYDPLAGVPWFGRIGLLAVIGLAVLACVVALVALLGGLGLFIATWFS